jgi:hypothetical protein
MNDNPVTPSLRDPEYVEREFALLRAMTASATLDLDLVQRVVESREQLEPGMAGLVRRNMWLADQTPALLARIRDLETALGEVRGDIIRADRFLAQHRCEVAL